MLVRCPAKINTFLAVGKLDRRKYHPLRTVFQAVGLFDDLEVEIASEDSFESSVPLPERNTVTKARRLLGEVAEVPPLRIRLEKRIPSEAGFGGGSSDAAGLIRAVIALTGRPIPEKELGFVAAAVGADVPFFLVGGRARAEGYGEILTPLPDEPEEWLVLAKPEIGGSTPEMFGRLDQLDFEWREFPEDLRETYNDFERVAPCECLDLIELLRLRGANRAGLSGSGSGVFGFFDTQEAAQRCATGIDVETWVVPTLARA